MIISVEPDEPDEPEVHEVPDKCNTSYDAIALIRNELFIFKGIYMFRPDSSSDAIEIRRMWKDLPENFKRVDAVYEKDDGEIWFFIARDIFIFAGTNLIEKSSLSHLGIDHHFHKIDAIFRWHYNDKSYIFSGDQYWRLEGDIVDRHYPKDILRSFHEVYDVDTAYSDSENLFFFKGNSFFEFNSRTMRIDRMMPQSSAQRFMRCPARRMFKLATRVEGELLDVIDDGQVDEFPDDDDNIELQGYSAKTSNALAALNIFLPLMLASLAISRVPASIFLQF